jgi:hypothetical protein
MQSTCLEKRICLRGFHGIFEHIMHRIFTSVGEMMKNVMRPTKSVDGPFFSIPSKTFAMSHLELSRIKLKLSNSSNKPLSYSPGLTARVSDFASPQHVTLPIASRFSSLYVIPYFFSSCIFAYSRHSLPLTFSPAIFFFFVVVVVGIWID